MGGNAFRALLRNAHFPRMPPATYDVLKAQLLPILQSFYTHATVAPECPDKVDHGDLDIVVTGPRESFTHEQLKSALRATCSISQEGPRTSNFAIPMDDFEEVRRAHERATVLNTNHSEDTGAATFVQVDVNVCADHAQLERTVFYTSFGDLGFVLGLLAQAAGLSFNIFGLKLAAPIETSPAQTFYLSTSMSDILEFFGLTMDIWARGFASQEDIFAWVAGSPFVRPLVARYRSSEFQPSMKKRVDARPMRQNFVEFLQRHEFPDLGPRQDLFAEVGRVDEKVDTALRYFGRYEEHARLLYLTRVQRRAKEILNGTNIQDWTGVMGVPVRFVKDEVKERLPGYVSMLREKPPAVKDVPEWQQVLLEMSDDQVRALVVSVKEEMQADGRLDYDWRTAKAATQERKQRIALQNGGLFSEGEGQD